jgi:hypothetical protein
MVRYTSSGAVDTSFGNNGRVFTTAGSFADATVVSLALQPDGRILTGGSNGNVVVARYLP